MSAKPEMDPGLRELLKPLEKSFQFLGAAIDPIPGLHEPEDEPSWPAPESISIRSINGSQRYLTPDGPMPRVTGILRVNGLSSDALIAWSAREERKAVLEACATVYAGGDFIDGPAGFAAAVENEIGAAKQHQKLLTKGAEIGSEVHAMIQWTLRHELGEDAGPEPALSDPAQVAFMSFEDWWKGSGLTALRMEQPVWDSDLGYAGTVDLIARDSQGEIGIVDFKSSRGIYDSHHLQVAAYCHAARRWSPIEWAEIVRFPKSLDDPRFEVKPLGQLYDRKCSEADLMLAFTGFLAAWKVLVEKEGK